MPEREIVALNFSVLLSDVLTSRSGAVSSGMTVYLWEWLVLGLVIVGLILFDMLGHIRKAHEPTLKEAAIWSALYISIAVVFGFILLFRHGSQFSTEYFAGYITELSLSLDNIFVFIIIIAAFKVPRIYQQKVLLYGIVISLILRFIFILLGAKLIEHFVWVFFIFGAWMLYAAIKQMYDGYQDSKKTGSELATEEYEPNLITRLISRYVPVSQGYNSDRFTVKEAGKTFITPLMLCIVSIGSVDLMFALDSIPAIYGLTSEPFIVFAANAFALSGLRQLFFLVDGLLERLIYLHYGLAIILGFIAVKLLLHASHGYNFLHQIPEPSISFSVGFILVSIIVMVVASLIGSRIKENK